jgi:shikimate dehydrogenase
MLIERAIARALPAFLAAEWPGTPARTAAPVLAAVGTLAADSLTSPLLSRRLAAAGVAPAGQRPHPDPEALLADPTWSLALVLSPFKQAVPALCGRLTRAAQATGVVDTLVRREGAVVGVNTNAQAAASALGLLTGGSAPERALIAGTGASARSVAIGLRRLFPAAPIGFVGRSAARAEQVVADLGLGEVVGAPAGYGADLVVNTTTVGQNDDATDLAFDLAAGFGPGVRFMDLNNRVSALQAAAVAAGCVTMSGVCMQLVTNALRVALLGDSGARALG